VEVPGTSWEEKDKENLDVQIGKKNKDSRLENVKETDDGRKGIAEKRGHQRKGGRGRGGDLARAEALSRGVPGLLNSREKGRG